MIESFIGEIRMVAFQFAPQGWAACNGQLLPISQNTALFSLIGTSYGGDGRTNFALPDLRSRVPIHQGQSRGTSNKTLGQSGGAETIPFTPAGAQIPKEPQNPTAIYYANADQPISSLPPYVVVNFIICIQGYYPSRPEA